MKKEAKLSLNYHQISSNTHLLSAAGVLVYQVLNGVNISEMSLYSMIKYTCTVLKTDACIK